MPRSKEVNEVLPRYVFLEPLLAGRRVLEIGALGLCGSAGARLLRERGAEHVTTVDTDDAAIESARGEVADVEGLEIAYANFAELPVGAFDLVIAHRCHGLLEDAAGFAALMNRVSSDGHLVLIARHQDGLALRDLLAGGEADPGPGYGDLAEGLKDSFASIEIAMQTSFVGYSVAPYGVEDPEVSLDWSLSGAAEAAYYLFVCGAQPCGLAAQAVTPLPTASVVADEHTEEAPSDEGADLTASLRRDLEEDVWRERVRELQDRLATAEKLASKSIEDARRNELTAAQALASRAELARRFETAQAGRAASPELVQWRNRAEDLERAVAAAETRATEAEQARDASEQREAESVEHLRSLEDRIATLTHELEHMKHDLDAERTTASAVVAELELTSSELNEVRRQLASLSAPPALEHPTPPPNRVHK